MPNVSPQSNDHDHDEPRHVRLASIDLVPQDDGRLTVAVTFSPAASALLRALELGGAAKKTPKRKPARGSRDPAASAEPRVKTGSRVKKPTKAAVLGSLFTAFGLGQ